MSQADIIWSILQKAMFYSDFAKLLEARDNAANAHKAYAEAVNEGAIECIASRDAWYAYWKELDEEVKNQIEAEISTICKKAGLT